MRLERIPQWYLSMSTGKIEKRYSWQSDEVVCGSLYEQSRIIITVSESLASWNGARPVTSMNRMTPKLQISTEMEIVSEKEEKTTS